MRKIEIVPEERQKILENPDLILLDKELYLCNQEKMIQKLINFWKKLIIKIQELEHMRKGVF